MIKTTLTFSTLFMYPTPGLRGEGLAWLIEA